MKRVPKYEPSDYNWLAKRARLSQVCSIENRYIYFLVRMSLLTFSAGVLNDSYNIKKVERKFEIAARTQVSLTYSREWERMLGGGPLGKNVC